MILREFRRHPEGLADLLGWALLVADGVVLQKDGSFLTGWEFRGPDIESASPEELEALSHRLSAAMLPLTSTCCLHVDAIRRRVEEYPTGGRFAHPVAAWIDAERRERFARGVYYETVYRASLTVVAATSTEARIARALVTDEERVGGDHWHRELAAFEELAAEFGERLAATLAARRLGSGELLAHLHETLTGLAHPVAVPRLPVYLDVLLADQDLRGGFQPRIGDLHLRVLSVEGMPGETAPALLAELASLPGTFRWSTRFLALDTVDAERHLEKRRKRWWAKRHGIWQLATSNKEDDANPNTAPRLDQDAVRMAEEVDQAKAENAAGLARYGFLTTTVVVYDEDPAVADRNARLLRKELQNRGLGARIETTNAMDAWRGSLPGNSAANVRLSLVRSLNLADLLPTAALWAGRRANPSPLMPKGSPCLLVGGAGSTPFFFNLHVQDVGHSLVLGPTGAGKSTLLGLIEAQWLRYPGARVFHFDKGHSALALCLAVAGAHYELGAENAAAPQFAPLARIADPLERQWAAEWIDGLVSLSGLNLTHEHRQAIRQALDLVAATDPHPTLTNYAAKLGSYSRELASALADYALAGRDGAGGGGFADLFDGERDQLSTADLQVFEMSALATRGQRAVAPALLYLFHRINASLDGRPTLILLDEAWTYLLNQLFAAQIIQWLKELRKKNAAVVFATQSLADVLDSPYRSTILESCPTKLFLPNPEAAAPHAAKHYELLGLSPHQVELLAKAQPKRDYYLVTPEGRRMFRLDLGPVALSFVGAGGAEDLRAVRELRAAHGLAWPARWLELRGVPAPNVAAFPAAAQEGASA
ncbi:MAG: hypothetical protein AMXMBFR36_38440 [Acidobacteriota bacterium]